MGTATILQGTKIKKWEKINNLFSFPLIKGIIGEF